MEDPLPKLLVLGAILMLAITTGASGSTMEQHGDNYIIANAPHFYPHTSVLATVDCMEEKESSCDPTEINLDDWHESIDGVWVQGSYGCMQFSPFTFQEQCVEIYGLEDDIMSCRIARECAIKMVADDKGYHWSTYKYCD